MRYDHSEGKTTEKCALELCLRNTGQGVAMVTSRLGMQSHNREFPPWAVLSAVAFWEGLLLNRLSQQLSASPRLHIEAGDLVGAVCG